MDGGIAMNSEYAIEINNVKKSFKVYADKSKQLKDLFSNFKRGNYERRDVLRGITFHIKKGEAVGLIGKNGCGKSTTLKMMTKILRPSEGSIVIKGRVSSLIELGAGFHPDMSGRENIYINASIFGFTNREIDNKIDDIIRFSELEEFIDNPIRTYSSGMYMRLAFSVAINVNADILLIDEILSVGDSSFQTKCFNKLNELKRQGITIVIVSHSLEQIEQICDRAIWISNGLLKEEGIPREICRHYLDEMEELRQERAELEQRMVYESDHVKKEKKIDRNLTCRSIAQQCAPDAKREGNGEVYFSNIRVCNLKGETEQTFETGEGFKVIIQYQTPNEGLPININFSIMRNDWIPCYAISSRADTKNWIITQEEGRLELTVDANCLLPNKYLLSFEITGEDGKRFDIVHNIIQIKIKNNISREYGIVSMQHTWVLN